MGISDERCLFERRRIAITFFLTYIKIAQKKKQFDNFQKIFVDNKLHNFFSEITPGKVREEERIFFFRNQFTLPS